MSRSAQPKTAESPVLPPEPPAEAEVIVAEEEPQGEPETATAAAPSQDDLLQIIRELKSRLDRVEGRQEESFPDDDKLFIAKDRGRVWEDRVIDPATKSYVDVQRVQTAFYGPFLSQEAISAYISAKGKKRDGAYMEWEDIRTVTGREKREIEARERAALDGSEPRRGGYFAR